MELHVGKLTVSLRNETGKGQARRLRAEGLVPGVCYGVGLDQPLPITLNPRELKASLDPIKRQNTVIDLDVHENGASRQTIKVMLKEYQIDPIRREVTHVDLVAIDETKKVVVEVPVEVVGKAPGVVEGGQLFFPRHSVHVYCRPADIPAKFELDVSELGLNEVLHISDLVMPEGVEVEDDEGLALVNCVAPTEEEEPEVEEGAEVAAAAEPAAAEGKGEEKKEEKK